MLFMLDTNICIYIIKRKPVQVLQKLITLNISDVVISTVAMSELEYGVAKSSQPDQNREALSNFVAPIEIVAFDEQAAFHYGQIRTHLEREGKVIGPMDMLIAAHALSLSCILVTNNVREFERVPGLNVENWV